MMFFILHLITQSLWGMVVLAFAASYLPRFRAKLRRKDEIEQAIHNLRLAKIREAENGAIQRQLTSG